MRLLGAAAAVLLMAFGALAQPSAADATVRQLWQQIDYVGADYRGAVAGGRIVSESEYAEMREFSDNALRQAQSLPERSGRDELLAAVSALKEAVERRAAPGEVGSLARHASQLLLASYPVPVAPAAVPDLERGARLYESQCAACHGVSGKADGPRAAQLEPPPVAFADRDRARSRSLLALYQTISQGVPGTSMPGFAQLSDADRWALAFFAGTLSHDAAMRERGEAQWRADPAAKAQFPDLAALTTATEESLENALGIQAAGDLTAYLRTHPRAIASAQPTGLGLARDRLARSLAAAHAGDWAEASRLGLSSYLDGFEPIEPALGARDRQLLADVESRMQQYRAALAARSLDAADGAAQRLQDLFTRAEATLAAGATDPGTTFVGALTILLREGLEALLIVVGMLAFLRKSGRTDVARHVHAGWIVALGAGVATWGAATYVVGISGANREVTEGLSSLFASIVLLGVGLWMHQKSAAGRWQAYLKTKLSSAMSRRSAWALFLLAFVAVYREVFETVLFYSALAAEGHRGALLAGLGAGIGILGVIAWLLLRTSARMPIGRFFSASSVLVAVLAIVLAGKGVAALQEAGWLASSPLAALPRIEWLGVFPSAQSVAAQMLVLIIAVIGFRVNAISGRRAPPSAA